MWLDFDWLDERREFSQAARPAGLRRGNESAAGCLEMMWFSPASLLEAREKGRGEKHRQYLRFLKAYSDMKSLRALQQPPAGDVSWLTSSCDLCISQYSVC